MILEKRILQIFFSLALLSSALFVSAQVRVINNKGTVSTIDTSRAITGAAIYAASPEQYTLSAPSAVKSGTIAIFTPTSANTTTTPLLKAGTQAAGVVITKNGHHALVAGDIAVGVPVITIFDGINWVLQAPQGSSTGSITTIGTPTTSYAAGANLSGNTLTMGLADAANPGLVSTGSQTFSGQKIFNNSTTVFGVGEGATPTTTFIRGPQAGGSGTAGADLYIQASNGIGAGGSGNIVFQTGSASTISSPTVSTIENRTFGNSNSHTFSGYTVPATGTNKLLLVEINLGYTNLAVSSVTYNSSSLNQLGYITSSSNRMEIWYLVAPVTDTSSDIVVNLSGYAALGITAMVWTNVNQSSPFGAVASASNGFGTTVSLSPSSSLGQVVMDFLTTTTSLVTSSSGQNLITSASNGSTCYGTSGYRAAISGTTTMSYTFGSSNYGYMAFAINPSTIGGSNALTDALKINNSGNTVLASGKKLVFTDNSTGTVGLTAPSSVMGYTLTLPSSAGSSNELLTTDGAGNLSWTAPGSLSGLNATAPLNYNSGTISINQATSGTSGYLSSSDWTTFNNKVSGVTGGSTKITIGGTATAPIVDVNTANLGAIGLTTGSTGTDVNVSGTPANLGGSLTLNIPDASATARGLVTTGDQTFAGNKTFTGNFAQTGTGTFSTGTGAVSINGDATMAATKTLYLAGSTSGTIGLKGDGAVTSYTLTLPAAAPTSSGMLLTSTTGGVLSWVPSASNVPLNSITAATAANTPINNANFAQAWEWNSATTQTALTLRDHPSAGTLTTGGLLALNSTSTGLTGSVLSVNSASTSAFTNGGVRFNFTGAHTGSGFQINDITTTGAVQSINATGVYTGTGLWTLNANSATTGTIADINANALTSGTALSVGGASAITGSLGDFVNTGASNSTNGLLRVFNNNASTTGTVFRAQSNSTGGTGLTVLASGNTGLGTITPVATLHNAGSTLFGTLALANFAANGVIGTAAATVDAYTSINISQSTAGVSLTIPSPSNTTAGRILKISNSGTTPFIIGPALLEIAQTVELVWNGSAWSLQTGGLGWSLTGNGGAIAGTNFLGTTNDVPMNIASNNTTMLQIGRRQTLGLYDSSGTGSFPYNQADNAVAYLAGGSSGVSALQFQADAANFYKPILFTDPSGNFMMRGSAAGTDFFELGSAGTANNGQLIFTIGDDGDEPMIFRKYNYTTQSYVEMMRLQGTGLNDEIRVGINTGGAAPTSTLQIDDVTTTGAVQTINATGVYTGTGLWNLNANSATTGTVANINVNALTTGTGLNISSSSTSNTSTNGLLRVANTTSTTTGTVFRAQSNSTAGTGLTVEANNQTGVGTDTPNTTLDVNGDVAVRMGAFTAVNGNNNHNISIGNRSFIRITGPTAAFGITGIAGGYDGKMVILYNTTGNALTIARENTGSIAANRILTLAVGNLTTTASNGSAVTLIYDATSQRWIVTAVQN